MDPVLLIIIGLAAITFISKGVPSWAELTVTDVRFKVTSISLAGYSGIIYVDVQNSSRSIIPFDRGNGSLLYGGNSIGNFILKKPVKLEPGKITTVEIDGSIPALGFGIELIQAIKTGNYLKNLDFKGELIYGVIKFPITRQIYKAK